MIKKSHRECYYGNELPTHVSGRFYYEIGFVDTDRAKTRRYAVPIYKKVKKTKCTHLSLVSCQDIEKTYWGTFVTWVSKKRISDKKFNELGIKFPQEERVKS